MGDNAVAVVTGASRGIGLEIAKFLTSEGYETISLSRTPPSIESKLIHIETDLTSMESIQQAFIKIKKEFGRVDVLINNAAVLKSQYLMITPEQSISSMIDTNLTGSIFVSREAIKIMRKRQFGRIIMISSMATALKPIGDAVYAASKAGLETFSSILARECQSIGITSNVLAISAFDTEMYRSLSPENVQKVVDGIPIPGFVSVEDITNVVDFLISTRSGGITAQIIRLGGVS
jgi:3-oxoacyl-[acyl-carrier protein] reductase